MRYRQIHLDFHTSPVIPDVGSDFDVQDFVKTLKEAHVNSINIFAKCHHGMCYYPTKVGRMHPGLKFDLLGTMIEELHKNDITCPVYFPLGWEEDAAEQAEWLEIGRDGIPGHKLPTDAGYYRWRKLCLNNKSYRKHIKAQLGELLDNYDIDGLWFDIVGQEECLCPTCLSEMRSLGLNPDNDTDVKKHDDLVLTALQDDLNDFVRKYNPNISTVYNTAWVPDGAYDEHTIENRALRQSHIELESLPSGEWGYLHFPLLANYHNRDNKPLVGMNGKFHLSWGDHGSLKNQEALEFECFRMIANGCLSCVGDQLHPRGAMNHSAYKRIGEVYKVIESLEPYLKDTQKVADIGVVVSADFYTKDSTSDEGVLRMLMQLHYQFDFISITDDISRYSLIILPDCVQVTKEFDNVLKSFIDNGGRVLSTYKSTCDSIKISYVRDNEFTPSYIVIDEGVNNTLETSLDPLEYVCYETGACVNSSYRASDIVAYTGKPYFNRTCDCFSSHRHFPFEKVTDHPAILLSDSVGYCAFPLFRDYIINGNRVFKDIIGGLIKKLMPCPTLITDAPSYAEITLRKKIGSGNTTAGFIIHILSYIPQKLTKTIDIVNEPIELHNVNMQLKCKSVQSILCVRSGISPEYKVQNDYVTFTVSKITGYEVIEVNCDPQ